jgi:hypothetical protein
MTTLQDRLRKYASEASIFICHEAADNLDAADLKIAELQAENEALRKDAKRYRKIRDRWDGEPASAEFYPCIRLYNLAGKADAAFCEEQSLDAAIDAAK